jgi:hypothetical protein
MDSFRDPLNGDPLYDGARAPQPQQDYAPLEVMDWMESLKMARGSQFSCTVERQLLNGTSRTLPQIKNRALSTDDVGRMFGPGVYRVGCKWRKPEWTESKALERWSDWFEIPVEYEIAHQEWLDEQEEKRLARKGGAVTGPVASAQATDVRSLVELARTMTPQGSSGGSSDLAAMMQAQSNMFLAVLSSQQQQAAQMVTMMQSSSREMMTLVMGVINRPNPNMEVNPLHPQLPAPGGFDVFRQKMAEMKEIRTMMDDFAPTEEAKESGFGRVVEVIMGLVTTIGPALLKGASNMPAMVTNPIIHSRPAIEQASLYHLQKEPRVQEEMFHNLVEAGYTEPEAQALVRAAVGIKVTIEEGTLVEGTKELLTPPAGDPAAPGDPSADAPVIGGSD